MAAPRVGPWPRGSEWSRWDLHVHTPDSLVQNYGRGGVDPWEAFISDIEALPSEFRVIGVNDYLFLDGYRRLLRERRENDRMQNIALFLPVIELRLNHFGGTEHHLSRANLHVIFSDELDAEVIQAQFVNGLKCDLKLTPTVPGVPDWSSIVTRESLTTLGAASIAAMAPDRRANAASEILEGFNNFNVSLDNVLELLANPIFTNRHMLAIGKTEWSDHKWRTQSAAFKRTLINTPHFVFTAADTPSAFARARQQLADVGVNARLIDGSDAHHLSTTPGVSTRVGNCMTWINALPTFEGLRHAYYEYDTRVYVGDTPEKISSTQQHPTQHADQVRISVREGQIAKPYFDADLPLNPGFVAIVGNKGRGKSALTDIIGLLGDSRRGDHYSFLTRSRFRDPKNNLAAKHEAELTWLSGKTTVRSLEAERDTAATESVQYLPQSFLESVCNEGPGSDALFTQELGEVIFAHVPEAERLGAGTLEELIDARTTATQRRIEIIRGELTATIAQVLELESQLDPQVQQHLENRIAEKEAELKAHDAMKPATVPPPADYATNASELERNIELVRDKIEALDGQLRRLQSEANEKSRFLERARELRKELENLDHQVTTFRTTVAPIAAELGLDLAQLVTFSVQLTLLDALITKLGSERDAAAAALSVTSDGTPASQVAEARQTLVDLEAALDAPQREYQAYLSRAADWERQRAEIVGSPTTPESLEYLKDRLTLLAEAPNELEALREKRTAQALLIHSELLQVAARLREIHAPVQAFIDDHPVVRDRFNLSFEVTLVEEGLGDQLFAMINRQVNGSFAGADEGRTRLESALAETNFNSPDAVAALLTRLDDELRHDTRPGRGRKRTALVDQLRKGASAQRLYELIFGLEYLSAEFWLESDARPISQLSPGQRGTLLLLFYLLVDKGNRPIVLDQPEENLDNQTVHELLVPAIAVARKHRQVIAVTHNPNLAVVGDADQVIVAELDGDAFAYVSGAIEDPTINERIVQILEGTWPAFENRREKYTPTSVLERAS